MIRVLRLSCRLEISWLEVSVVNFAPCLPGCPDFYFQNGPLLQLNHRRTAGVTAVERKQQSQNHSAATVISVMGWHCVFMVGA